MKVRRMPMYETDATGQKVKRLSAKFYAIWQDYTGQLRRLPLLEDRKASEEIARNIVKLNNIRASGDSTLPPELARCVEAMPPGIRDRLAAWDILATARVAAGKPLADHIADWKAALLAKGGTDRHAELVTSRARKAVAACGFKMWSDISASKLEAHLADLRLDRKGPDGNIKRGLSAQTFNFYLQAAKQFCRWMVRDRRATENPLAHLQGLNVKTDRRHDRRALSPDELRWLLDVTEHGHSHTGLEGKPVVVVAAVARFGMSATDRAMLYRLAVETGLRAGELRSLTRASFCLEGDEPSVTIAAAYAKNRRQDTLPVRAATAALLKEHLAGKMPNAQAFNVPIRTEVSRMFRADLKDARRAWLESLRTPQERNEATKGTFLAERDDSGRFADFHALRHSFITGLVLGGVNPKVAQSLARHSVITLTMDRYSHVYTGNLSAALDVLPDLSAPSPQVTVATGTNGQELAASLSPNLSPNSGSETRSAEFGAVTLTSATMGALSPEHTKSPEISACLTAFQASAIVWDTPRRSARAADWAGLENR